MLALLFTKEVSVVLGVLYMALPSVHAGDAVIPITSPIPELQKKMGQMSITYNIEGEKGTATFIGPEGGIQVDYKEAPMKDKLIGQMKIQVEGKPEENSRTIGHRTVYSVVLEKMSQERLRTFSKGKHLHVNIPMECTVRFEPSTTTTTTS